MTKRISLMMAAAPLCSFYSMSGIGDDPPPFVQPTLDPAPGPDVVIVEEPASAVVVDNTGKTDELSLAVAAEDQRKAVFIEPPKPIEPKYQLAYTLDGKAVTEKHGTVDGAMASVRRLRVLGIIPATSTL